MQRLIKTHHDPIRTVLHLTPGVTTAALVRAQRQGQRLGDWLANLIVQSCASDEAAERAERLSDLMTLELFAHIATHCPGALTGQWKLLFERCLQDVTLWRYPEVSLEDAEAGSDCQPVLDVHQLRRRWPDLVASVWLTP